MPPLLPPVAVHWLRGPGGGPTPYGAALRLQKRLAEARVRAAVDGRSDTDPLRSGLNILLMLEHAPVYTSGRRQRVKTDSEAALSSSESESADLGAQLRRNTGAEYYELGVRSYVHALESALIVTCARFGVAAGRSEHTGVWVGGGQRKIAALGVQVSRNVTTHGLALNCDVDLAWFAHITACGLPDKETTSLSAELQRQQGRHGSTTAAASVSPEEAAPVLTEALRDEFGAAAAPALAEAAPELARWVDGFLAREAGGEVSAP
ncbi:putative lipoyltransferase 2, mitochondrial [Cladochytrium tenue]|nr:putative lipoyltransferase 2, mitochondrial [Cladochytrium tenue]